MVDPPWRYGDMLPGPGRGAAKHYDTMSQAELLDFKLPAAAPSSLLVLWRVAAMVRAAEELAEAWGFTPKSEIVWVKTRSCKGCMGRGYFVGKEGLRLRCDGCEGRGWRHGLGMGRYVRNNHEVAIIAVRGKNPVVDHSVRSIIYAPIGRHSEKPVEAFRVCERLIGGVGPFAEVFSRRDRAGWCTFGDEAGKWS